MNYSGAIIINKPREIVTKIFINPDHIKEYQDGFVKKTLQRGEMGETGAVSKLFYKYGKRDMILTETIISNNLPDSFVAQYHHKHMDNSMKCKFLKIDENTTKYEYTFEYTRMSLMPKLMAKLFPNMYRRQGEKWMNQFKVFVENN